MGRFSSPRGRFARGAMVTAVVVITAFGALASTAFAVGPPSDDEPSPIARGPHVSGAVRYQPQQSAAAPSGPPLQCSTPGAGNYRSDCQSSGRPVNETWITYGNGTYYAGANDYNSYNGQGQNGFYWSSDAVNWNDAGPLDLLDRKSVV